MNRRTLSAAALTVALLLPGCKETPVGNRFPVTERNHTATVSLSALDVRATPTVVEVLRRHIRRTHDLLDADLPASDIARINSVGTTARIQISRDTLRLLDLAQRYAEGSEGAYDFTSVTYASLWGLDGSPAPSNTPPTEMLAAARPAVGYGHLALLENSSAALTQPGARIEVDALADAYAIDLATVELRKKEVGNILIQLGDSARGHGVDDRGSPWTVDLPDPARTNASLGTIRLAASPAVAWARLQERTVTIDGKTYGGLIDPRTGRPASGTAMAVVLAPVTTQARALALALIVSGKDGAAPLLEAFPRCEVLVIPEGEPQEAWMTDGFRLQFSLTTGCATKVIERSATVPATPSPERPAP